MEKAESKAVTTVGAGVWPLPRWWLIKVVAGRRVPLRRSQYERQDVHIL